MANESVFKKGFLALTIMGISFIAILFSFFIDRVLVLILGFELDFSIFYYIAWTSGAFGLISAYFGFVKPRAKQ
ncbi:MAG: hypothetical protein ACFFAS_06195 [Promethearchaeota archaeon]